MAGTTLRDRVVLAGRFRWRTVVAAFALVLLAAGPIAARDALPPWPAPGDGSLVNDPDVTWGRLPNGLRYAILPNATPPGRVSLRLLIEAGSLMEHDGQRGLAHFLEHMAFKGSTNLAPGALISYLQRAGLSFGADTNAQTGFDSTVYQLDLPRNDAALVDDGLGILSDYQGRLLLDTEQIESERGVILSEKRVRDTPSGRSFEAMLDFLLPGSRYAAREPIGLEQIIKTAPRDRFVDFYHDWYTPERSVVVVAGDVQPAAIIPMIEAHFGDLTQPANAPADPAYQAPANRGLDALLFSDPGLPATVSLNVVLPFDPRPDSLVKEKQELLEQLASAMLERRLDSIGRQAGAPFAQAGVGASDLAPEARIATLRLKTTADGWRGALAAGEQELRRALDYGFSDVELREQLAIYRNQLQTAAAGAATRESPRLAVWLVDAISDDQVFSSPATDLAVFDELAQGLRPGDIDQALRGLWGGREPQIFLSGPMQLDDPREAILAVYRASLAVAVAAPESREAVAFAYHDFGPPSGVVRTERIEDLDITRVTFGNGVQLDFKRTPFAADQIQIAVRFGNGRIGLPLDQPGLGGLAGRAFVDGGLGRQSIDEITRTFASRQADIDLVLGESGLALLGRTTPGDLPFQLDLLAAYATDPGYRPESMQRYLDRLAATYAQLAATPGGALPGPVALLLHDGDTRFAMPTEDEARQRTLAELRDWLTPQLHDGPLRVIAVGDIDPTRLIEEVGRTFGALPARGPAVRPAPPILTVPTSSDAIRLTYQGTQDDAMAQVYWPTTSQSDATTAIGLDLVADILGDRLLHEVRDRAGATYSPEAASQMSLILPGFGYLGAALDVPAGDADRFGGVIRDVGAAMHAGGITQDELDRALQPRLAQARTSLETNDFWFYQVLIPMEQFPFTLDDARRLVADHESQTLASVQALATRYLDPARALTVLVTPGDPPEPVVR